MRVQSVSQPVSQAIPHWALICFYKWCYPPAVCAAAARRAGWQAGPAFVFCFWELGRISGEPCENPPITCERSDLQ